MDKIIVSCSNSIDLAKNVAQRAQIPYVSLNFNIYSCNEYHISFKCPSQIRAKDIILFQGITSSGNESFMELLLSLELINKNEPKSVSVILPYFYYSRQDKNDTRHCQGAELLIKLLNTLGVNKLITLDLHSQLNYKGLPLEIINLMPSILFAEHIKKNHVKNGSRIIIVAPDKGSVYRSNEVAKILEFPLIKLIKLRENGTVIYESILQNLSNNFIYILVDDIIDTGKSLTQAAEALFQAGARRIIAYVTHGILNDSSYKLIESSKISKLYVTNSITNLEKNYRPKIEVLPIEGIIEGYLI